MPEEIDAGAEEVALLRPQAEALRRQASDNLDEVVGMLLHVR
jgi:hypothetical protein